MVNIKSHRKGKTYEEEYGAERAKQLKEKLSISHKGQIPINIEKLKNHEYSMWYNNPNKIKEVTKKGWATRRLNGNDKHNNETRKKISESKLGQIPWNKGNNSKYNNICKLCNNNFLTYNKNNRFCSRICYIKGHKPHNYIDGRSKLIGPGRYGDDWDNIRYLIYLRDRFTCQDCNITGISLDVHHIVPFLISRDNSLNNLISLCRSCHMKRERSLIKEQQLQLIEV